MNDIRYAKCHYTMVWGLKNGRFRLTDAEIERGIANGIIVPVLKHGWQFYRYSPDEVAAFFFD